MKSIFNKNRLGKISGSCLICMALVSHPAAAFDLWDAYQLALAGDPIFQAAELNHDVNKLELPLAETEFSPFITANAQLGKRRSDFTGPTETSDDHNLVFDFDLPLVSKQNRIAIAQSKQRVSISELELRAAKQDLIIRVADSYFNLLAAQDAREVATLEKIAIKRQMDLASERLEVGLGTRTDLFDAKARFKLAEANEILAQNAINNNIALLKQIIGINPQALTPLRESAPLDLPSPNDLQIWTNNALQNNVALQIQQQSVDLALEEIDRQRSTRSPTLSLGANYRWADSGTSFSTSSGISSGQTNSTTIALRLSVPLYQGGSVNLKTQQAGLQYNRAERLLEQARRAASTDTTSAFLDVSSGVSRVEALFDAITAGESALEAKEEGFNAGLTTNLDVLDAQRDLSRSRTNYLRSRYNYIISVLQLERSIGDLNEQDIKRVNGWLGDTN